MVFYKARKRGFGFTLVELIMAMLVSLVLILVVGIVLAGGQRSWNRTYNSANKRIKSDALGAASVFSSIGRKSDRGSYILNDSGDIEFRYWSYARDGRSRREPRATPTHFANFIFDEGAEQLKVDYGKLYPSRRLESTQVLAENVTGCLFTHSLKSQGNNVIPGQGCIRMVLTLTDPEDGEAVTVKSAVLLRN